MAVHDLSSIEAALIESWVAGPLYGINVVLFVLCVGVLWKRNPWKNMASRYLLLVTTVQLVAATGHIATCLAKVVHAFVTLEDVPGGTEAFLSDFTAPLHVAEQALYTFNDIIAGGVLTWRCYVVWDYTWRPAVPLIFSCIVTTVAGIGSIATLSMLPPGFSKFFSPPLRYWLVVFWLSSIVTQIGATTLIAWKIWSTISWRARQRGSVEWAILRIFIESGALYSAGTVVVLCMYLLRTAAGTIVAGMLGQLGATAPYLIIVRAEAQRSSARQREPDYVSAGGATAARQERRVSLGDMDTTRRKSSRFTRFMQSRGPRAARGAAFELKPGVGLDIRSGPATSTSEVELPPGW